MPHSANTVYNSENSYMQFQLLYLQQFRIHKTKNGNKESLHLLMHICMCLSFVQI